MSRVITLRAFLICGIVWGFGIIVGLLTESDTLVTALIGGLGGLVGIFLCSDPIENGDSE